MTTDRKLISYLPMFMQEYKEMKTIMEAEQVEIDHLWSEVQNSMLDQFILDATENGVKRWESMLGISPKDTDTIDERKFRILTKLNQELPYTLRKLEQTLTNLCGVDGFSIDVQSKEYSVYVKLALDNRSNYQEVEKILNKMIPANMVTYIQIMYTIHSNLIGYTHEELSNYTHEQIKEVFVNG